MGAISKNLLKEFATVVVNNNSEQSKEQIVYATVTENGVRIDGSTVDTPVSSTTDRKVGERVTVMIKNHQAIITGNLTSPSAHADDVKDVADKVTVFEKVVAKVVTAEQFNAQIARINKLEAEDVSIKETLSANQATIDNLVAYDLEVKGKIEATEADISKLKTDKLDAHVANLTYATISDLTVTNQKVGTLEGDIGSFKTFTVYNFSAINADIENLTATKISAKDIEGKYANIDFSNITEATMKNFYANSGLIKDVAIQNGNITGELIGVTIRGDRIIANSIIADKLLIKGTDGLFYKINELGMKVIEDGEEQTDENSLHGSIITAESITADKIHVSDLQAFGATIGGFKITTDSIYSGVKSSISNTTNGVYLNKNGEINFGNASDYVKFYKDTSGNYKLDISANSITFGNSKKNLDTTVNDIYDVMDDIEVGGRNLLLNTKNMNGFQHDPTITLTTDDEGVTVASWPTRSSATWIILSSIPIKYELVKNRKVTCSIMVKSDDYEALNAVTNRGLVLTLRACNDSSMTTIKNRDFSFYTTQLSDKWTKISWSGTITDSYFPSGTGDISNATRIYISVFNYSTYRMDVKKLKLEFGDKATDWTEAPEDVQVRITNLDNDILDWCYNNNKTYINGNKIYAHTITTEQLSVDAIKSLNYNPGETGSYLNLADGSFDSPYFKWDLDGKIDATGGSIGGITIDALGISSSSDENNMINGFRLYNWGSISSHSSGSGRDHTITIYSGHVNIYSEGTNSGSMPKAITLNDTELYFYKYNSTAGYVKSSDDGSLNLYGASDAGVNVECALKVKGAVTIDSSLNTTSSITSASALISNGGAIELFGATPFIDFHRENSSSDYTHRIIANSVNYLTVTSGIKTNGNLYLNNGQYIYLADSGASNRVGMYLSTDNIYYLCSNTYQTILRGSSVKLSSTSGATVTSDENLKYDIEDLDERMDMFFDNLKPRKYKYVLGTSKRTHYGFITQEVEEALYKSGLTTKEFGGVNIIPIKGREIEKDENGKDVDVENSSINYLLDNGITEEHNLVYTEFISLLYYQVQKLKNEINKLKNTM